MVVAPGLNMRLLLRGVVDTGRICCRTIWKAFKVRTSSLRACRGDDDGEQEERLMQMKMHDDEMEKL